MPGKVKTHISIQWLPLWGGREWDLGEHGAASMPVILEVKEGSQMFAFLVYYIAYIYVTCVLVTYHILHIMLKRN